MLLTLDCSLAENLRQDLVIKEEMVSLLNEDKVRAEAARDDAIEKARLLQRRVKDAADTQDAERKKHSAKVEGLVAKLSTEISASNMAQRINPELGRLTAQLEEARSAVVSVQPLLDSYRQANAELDAANIAQAAELADLRRTAATSDPDLLAERDEAIRELREALAAKDQELDGLMDAREDRSTVSAGTRGSSQRRIEMLEEEVSGAKSPSSSCDIDGSRGASSTFNGRPLSNLPWRRRRYKNRRDGSRKRKQHSGRKWTDSRANT